MSSQNTQKITDYATSDPDVALMLRVKQDDAEAFRELVTLYQNRLLRLMESWTNSKEASEELVQEVFLRIYRARGKYEPTAKLSTWIFRIANNLARNAIRDRARRQEHVLATEGSTSGAFGLEEMAVAASASMPAKSIDNLERSEVVRLAIQQLPERQRIGLMLSKFENMSYQEISDSMELSVKAIKSLLSRARMNLKDILLPYIETGTLPPGLRKLKQANNNPNTTAKQNSIELNPLDSRASNGGDN